MKFGQIIEYNKRKIFLQKSGRKRGRRLFPDLFLFFKIFRSGKRKWSAV